jgi:predicted acetyltransferase
MRPFDFLCYIQPMVELQNPSLTLVKSYLEFIDEMKKHGDTVWEGMIPKSSEQSSHFVERLLRSEVTPEPGLVAETTYWGTIGNQVVGRIALRHELNENLAEFGGHIGYEAHPLFRRQGVATEMLRKVLQTPRALRMSRVLVTCAPDNWGSNKVIQANGGTLTKTAYVEKWKRDTNYYWIDLS